MIRNRLRGFGAPEPVAYFAAMCYDSSVTNRYSTAVSNIAVSAEKFKGVL